jgi:hypothetical protein
MTEKQSIYLCLYSWQKSFRLIAQHLVVKLTIIICLTVGIFTIWAINPPISYAETVLPKATIFSKNAFYPVIGVNTKSLNPTKSITDTKSTLATVYRSPECTCCKGWINHLKTEGFQIKDFLTDDIEAVKQKYKVPDKLASCHTAIIGGYVIEGHVPGKDIKNLLQQKPDIIGLSVPQMPVGTPGMEMGNQKDPFNVVSFDKNHRTTVFNKYFTS